MTEDDTTLSLVLLQPKLEEFNPISLYLVTWTGGDDLRRVKTFNKKDLIQKMPFKHSREVMLEATVKAGRYLIIPATFDQCKEASFLIRVNGGGKKVNVGLLKDNEVRVITRSDFDLGAPCLCS